MILFVIVRQLVIPWEMRQDLVKYKIYELFYLYFERQNSTEIMGKDPGAWLIELCSPLHCPLVVFNLFVPQFHQLLNGYNNTYLSGLLSGW